MSVISSITSNTTVTPPPVALDVRSSAQSGSKPDVSAQIKAAAMAEVNAQSRQAEKPITEQDVQKAINEATRELAGSSENIGFNYEKKLNQLYVQITDNNSGEVIREVPSKDFIRHRIAMQEMIGLILDRKV